MSEEKKTIRRSVSVTLAATVFSAMLLLLSRCKGGPTDPPGDTTRPTIVSVNPADGAVDVQLDASITVIFSEAVNASTISTSTFVINPSVTGIYIAVTGDTVTLVPAAPLAYGTTYAVSVTTGVTDLAGNSLAAIENWSFTTIPDPATTPPQVISTVPPSNSTDFDAAAPIKATFSKAIDTTTVTSSSFSITGVTGTFEFHDSVVYFIPDAILEYNTQYTATIDTTVADTFGNRMEAPYVWGFTTGDDPLIPTALIWGPADSAIIGDSVTITVLAGHPIKVEYVRILWNGVPLVDDSTEPFEYIYDASSRPIGSQNWFSALAFDDEGRVGFSDTVMVYYQWQPLITDDNEPSWPTDLKRILARSTDTLLEFRYEFWEKWSDDPVNDTTLDLGIYFDNDRSAGTGRADFDGHDLNGIGAEYRVIVGLHGLEAFAEWNAGNGQWNVLYDPTGFAYLDLPPDTNVLHFGIHWSDMGNPTDVRLVSINLWFLSPESFLADWVPDEGAGYVTVRREDLYIGEGYVEPSSGRRWRLPQATSSYDNPF